jgi:hypothetical protein
VIRRRAIAIVSVLRADAVSVLRDLSRNPVRVGERADYIADQLRLADVAGVAADYNHAPVRRFVPVTCWQFFPLTL